MMKVRFKVLFLVTMALSFNVLALSPKLTKAKAKMLLENSIEVSPEEFQMLAEEEKARQQEELEYTSAEESQYLEQGMPQAVEVAEEASLPQDENLAENLTTEEVAQANPLMEEY